MLKLFLHVAFSFEYPSYKFIVDPSYSGSCLALIKMTAEHQLDPPNGPNKAFETSQCTVTVEDQEGLTDTAEVCFTGGGGTGGEWTGGEWT